MNIETTKLEIFQYLLNTKKASVLEKVKEVFLTEGVSIDNDIVAYSIKGDPLTKTEYVKQIKEAEERIDNGQYTSHSDLLKKVQNW